MGLKLTEKSRAAKINNVANLSGEDHRPRIISILNVLGFTKIEDKARLFRQTPQKTEEILTGIDNVFSGGLLAHMCDELSLKPEVCLGRRNFDKLSSLVREGTTWKGPLPCFSEGDPAIGKALKSVIVKCRLETLSGMNGCTYSVLTDLVKGKLPVPIDMVRGVLREVKRRKIDLSQFRVLDALEVIRECDLHIPEGVCTIRQTILPELMRDIDPALRQALEEKYNTNGIQHELQTAERPPSEVKLPVSIQTSEKEKDMNCDQYRQKFAEEGVGKHLFALAKRMSKKNISLFVEDKCASASTLNGINAGVVLVSLKDIESNLNSAEMIGLNTTDEFIFLDEFVREVKQADKEVVTDSSASTQSVELENVNSSTPTKVNEAMYEQLKVINLNAEAFLPGAAGASAKVQMANRMILAAAKHGVATTKLGDFAGKSQSFAGNLSRGIGKIDTAAVFGLCRGLQVPPAFLLRNIESTPEEVELALNIGFDPELFKAAVAKFEDAEQIAPAQAETPTETALVEVSVSDGAVDNSVSNFSEEQELSDTEESLDSCDEEALVQTEVIAKGVQLNGHAHSAIVPVEEIPTELVVRRDDFDTREMLIAYAEEKLTPVCQKAAMRAPLEMLVKLARGEEVDPDDYVPALRQRHAAVVALQSLKDAYPEEYRSLLASLS